MEELSRIQARLESLGDLDELVGALRSMAASRAREAQEAFAGTRAYCDIVERAISEIAPLVRDLPDRDGGERILLVLTSENGFVGGFNTRLIDRMATERRAGERLIIVGRRGRVTAQEHRIAPDHAFAMSTHVDGVTSLARRIAARLSQVAEARILFAEHRPGAAFDIVVEQVLPIGAATLESLGAPPASPPLHQLPAEELMQQLSGEYLFAKIAHGIMESIASENNARLTTMDAASRNIARKLELLQRDERAARQEKTTTDMIEVVTGAQAVSAGR
ncbi:F0F1 ATP synthase subunit gamma [Pseudodonghicola flavimaris]|uniref:F0F1 ATP synthase subunit gamma n=1 Tax=Pseudodonghicola flavimaris TaxID=3050036 RepID=A0ABT7F5S0_9RHOB|nr:F0F1 ATP synthase subunit gamma [Pseudodonghicola flavimaris]MDK3019944.1 F0F1 ATP synthase subunit gamma [Pseudodonghicola flavimaris]